MARIVSSRAHLPMGGREHDMKGFRPHTPSKEQVHRVALSRKTCGRRPKEDFLWTNSHRFRDPAGGQL